MGCAVGDWAFWLWGGVSLNTPRPGLTLAPGPGSHLPWASPGAPALLALPCLPSRPANTLKPAPTPHAGEHVEVERPLQQLCPIHSRPPLLHPLLPGRCLTPRSRLLCLGSTRSVRQAPAGRPLTTPPTFGLSGSWSDLAQRGSRHLSGTSGVDGLPVEAFVALAVGVGFPFPRPLNLFAKSRNFSLSPISNAFIRIFGKRDQQSFATRKNVSERPAPA